MNTLINYSLGILILIELGSLARPLSETSNEEKIFSNFFHPYPPIHEDLKGRYKEFPFKIFHLNNYFDFHVCLPLRGSGSGSVVPVLSV